MKKNFCYDSVLTQWEKLTGKPACTEKEKTECYACYHESRSALILAALKQQRMQKNARV